MTPVPISARLDGSGTGDGLVVIGFSRVRLADSGLLEYVPRKGETVLDAPDMQGFVPEQTGPPV